MESNFKNNIKKLVVLVIMIPIWIGCSNDDDEIDCALINTVSPNLYLRIVDNTGTNLIENGTIDPNDISVESDFLGAGFRFIPSDEFSDTDFREFDNTLQLFIANTSIFQYTINFNNMDTISIDFTSDLTKILCGSASFKPIDATFNSETLELIEVSTLQFLVVIVL